jgi:hypothetical protein
MKLSHLCKKQKDQAKAEAQSLIDKGVNPDWKVRIQFYADNSPLADEEIMGLTDPVDPITCEGSLIQYHTLSELVEM